MHNRDLIADTCGLLRVIRGETPVDCGLCFRHWLALAKDFMNHDSNSFSFEKDRV